MLNFLLCSNLNNNKEVEDTKFELKSNTSNKKDINKEISSIKNNNLKTSINSSQSFIYVKTTFEEKEKEKEELNVIEYPEIKKNIVQKSLVDNNNNINKFIYKNYNFWPSKKIINEEDSSLIYFDDEDYNNINISNNNKEENINNKYCIYCEEIYKNAFKNNKLIKDKNCIYCNRLINNKTFKELINDGLFQSDDDESIIENCKSYDFED